MAVEVPASNNKTMETGVYQWIPHSMCVGSRFGRTELEVASQVRVKPCFPSARVLGCGTLDSGSKRDTGSSAESGSRGLIWTSRSGDTESASIGKLMVLRSEFGDKGCGNNYGAGVVEIERV